MAEAAPLKAQTRAIGDGVELERESRRRANGQGRIWGGILLCLVAAGALFAFRGTPVQLVKARTPVDTHKVKYLSARENGQLDDLRFQQNALLKLGFLQQKMFIISNRPASKVQLNLDGMQGENLQFATIEPRSANRLSIIAVKEDMPLWEDLVREADVKE
jgi:hypothetical protein